jgi:NADH:ubiquinone oxidoreductase subunit C
MPDDWDGHPMRKDYKEAAEYRGMPTTRYSPLELLVAYDKANPQTEGARPVATAKGGKGED